MRRLLKKKVERAAAGCHEQYKNIKEEIPPCVGWIINATLAYCSFECYYLQAAGAIRSPMSELAFSDLSKGDSRQFQNCWMHGRLVL